MAVIFLSFACCDAQAMSEHAEIQSHSMSCTVCVQVFPWSDSSTRAELCLNFHGVAESKCMFTVTVNLQPGEGK